MEKFYVEKTTTDKLEELLNQLTGNGSQVHQTQYLGGRDWVVIFGPGDYDPWHPKNWEAGTLGTLPAGLCNVWQSEELMIPCMYQRGHIGRHMWEPAITNEEAIERDRLAQEREDAQSALTPIPDTQ